MSVSSIDGLSQTSISLQQERNEPTLKEADGLLVVKNGRSEHPLQTEHCQDCLTLFKGIQIKAKEGVPKAKDLLMRAQTQMEALQSKQISALQQKSKTPISYASPKDESTLSVSFSSAAQLRAKNLSRIAVAAVEVTASPSDNESTQKASVTISGVDSGKASGDHSEGDGHGHGATAESAATNVGEIGEKKKSSEAADHGHHGDPQKALSEAELKEVQELSARDMEVRAHEQAHKSAAGSHGGAISLSFRNGPDGKRYAVEGEVPVDMSAVKGDPQATVAKMEQIHRAALAPAQPSSADRRVAARAAQKASKARQEIMNETKQENPLKVEHGTDDKFKVRDTDSPELSSEMSKVPQSEERSKLADATTIGTDTEIDQGSRSKRESADFEPSAKLTKSTRRTSNPYDQYTVNGLHGSNGAASDTDGIVRLSRNLYA